MKSLLFLLFAVPLFAVTFSKAYLGETEISTTFLGETEIPLTGTDPITLSSVSIPADGDVIEVATSRAVTLGGDVETAFEIVRDKPTTPYVRITSTDDGEKTLRIADHADFDFTSEFTIDVIAALDDWTPATYAVLVSKFDNGAGQASYRLNVSGGSAGNLVIGISADGTNATSFTSTSPIPATNGQFLALRVKMTANDEVTFWTSTNIVDPSIDDTDWTQLGDAVDTSAQASIHSGTEDITIGRLNDTGHSGDWDGKLARVRMFNSATPSEGAIVSDWRADRWLQGTTETDDGYGHTVFHEYDGSSAAPTPALPYIISGQLVTPVTAFTNGSTAFDLYGPDLFDQDLTYHYRYTPTDNGITDSEGNELAQISDWVEITNNSTTDAAYNWKLDFPTAGWPRFFTPTPADDLARLDFVTGFYDATRFAVDMHAGTGSTVLGFSFAPGVDLPNEWFARIRLKITDIPTTISEIMTFYDDSDDRFRVRMDTDGDVDIEFGTGSYNMSAGNSYDLHVHYSESGSDQTIDLFVTAVDEPRTTVADISRTRSGISNNINRVVFGVTREGRYLVEEMIVSTLPIGVITGGTQYPYQTVAPSLSPTTGGSSTAFTFTYGTAVDIDAEGVATREYYLNGTDVSGSVTDNGTDADYTSTADGQFICIETWDTGTEPKAFNLHVAETAAPAKSGEDDAHTWSATKLAHDGVLFEFDSTETVGRFYTGPDGGDPFVVGACRVTYRHPTRSMPDLATGATRKVNGAMINPKTLRKGGTWSYDTWCTNYSAANDYGQDAYIDLVPGQTLVVAVSNLYKDVKPGNGEEAVEHFVLLTCVASTPKWDAFRPPYCWEDTSPPSFRYSDLDLSLLPSLDTTGLTVPSPSTLAARYTRPVIDTERSFGRGGITPVTGRDPYGRDLLEDLNESVAYLASDQSNANKLDILKGFIQHGIDRFGVIEYGRSYGETSWFPNDGGHNWFRGFNVFVTGKLLGDTDMVARAVGGGAFGLQDRMGEYVTQNWVDICAGPTWDPYKASPSAAYVQAHVDGFPLPEKRINDDTKINYHLDANPYRFNGPTDFFALSIFLLAAEDNDGTAGWLSDWNDESGLLYMRRYYENYENATEPWVFQGDVTPLFTEAPGTWEAPSSGFGYDLYDAHVGTLQSLPWE